MQVRLNFEISITYVTWIGLLLWYEYAAPSDHIICEVEPGEVFVRFKSRASHILFFLLKTIKLICLVLG